jgi:Icc-related predicted phosphoesterase
MKIVAISDLHGILPDIPECDILLIAGDIAPLQIQTQPDVSKQWFETVFNNWITKIPATNVVMIAGNHDFYLYKLYDEKSNNYPWHSDKITYLCDDKVTINGITIYGTPWVTGLFGWAFNKSEYDFVNEATSEENTKDYSCDILLCHQPPRIGQVGVVTESCYQYQQNYGSEGLLQLINNKMPEVKYVICGHVHSGNHAVQNIDGINYVNVSYMNERYNPIYDPFVINL